VRRQAFGEPCGRVGRQQILGKFASFAHKKLGLQRQGIHAGRFHNLPDLNWPSLSSLKTVPLLAQVLDLPYADVILRLTDQLHGLCYALTLFRHDVQGGANE